MTTLLVLALAAGLVLSALIAGMAWLGLELLRQNGRLLERLDALEGRVGDGEVGAGELLAGLLGGGSAPRAAPDVPLTDPAGGTVHVCDLLSDELPLLLVFSDPGCGPCQALAPELAAWQRDFGDVLTVAVVGRGEDDSAAAYGVFGTPSAVLIAPDGLLEGGPVGGAPAIRALMRRAIDVTDATARPAASA